MSITTAIDPQPEPMRLLDRALTILAPVRAGEGAGALLLAGNVFLLLASYYVVKTVRESLILSEGGAEIKSYSAAGQALLLLLIVPAYGAFASRVNRIRLISWVTLFFVSHLAIFAVMGFRGFHVGIPFFLWVGIFNVLVIAQFWAFANDLYTEEQGKRLFAIVGVGSSLGAWAGSSVAGELFARFGPYNLMLLGAGLLLSCVVVSWLINNRESSRQAGSGETAAEKPLGKEGGFQLIRKDRYLLLIALLVLLLNVVNTTGEFLLGKLVVGAAEEAVAAANVAAANVDALKAAFIGEFYGNFFGW